jgi:hypothetical protein
MEIVFPVGAILGESSGDMRAWFFVWHGWCKGYTINRDEYTGMPDTALPPFWVIMTYTAVIVLSIAVLLFLFVAIPSGCASIIEATPGKIQCHLGAGAYLSGAIFVVLLVYAGFSLFRMLFPARQASCRVCSLLSKK